MGGSDVDIQLVVLDGTLYAALTPNNWLDMGPRQDIYDPSVVLNPDNGLANLLASITDAKSEASETINGVDTVRISRQGQRRRHEQADPAQGDQTRCPPRSGSRRPTRISWCRPRSTRATATASR